MAQLNQRPKLDRVVHFDEKSKQYPIRTVVPQTPRSYTWACPLWLDQGSEGACVGFSWAHELAGKPKPVINVSAKQAQAIYKAAQQNDEWPGEDYEGSSVLGGAKAVQAMGYLKEYRWAFGLQDLILAVGHAGPAVLGINWYEGMFEPDADGFVRPSGVVAGGHAILCIGVNVKGKYFRLHNSWGRDWGQNGEAKITFDDLSRLLEEQGEACIPLARTLGPLSTK